MKTLSKLKTKGLLIHLFEIPIYGNKVCFLRYDTEKAYEKVLSYLEEIGIKDESYKEDAYKYAYGFTDEQKTKHGIVYLVFINNAKEYQSAYVDTLAHENFHLVNFICKNNGIPFDENTDNEPYAYLTGYLFDLLSGF